VGVTPNSSGTPLDCTSARLLIDAYLLGTLDAASGAALRVHLAGCAACSVELRGFTSLVELLATMPEPIAAPDLDERLILAALADRRRRHEHHSWLQDLPRLVFRGAMRTTGTLIVTLVTVALLSSALVFAAGNFFAGTALNPTPGATVTPEVTPTLAPTPQQTAVPSIAPSGTTGPVAVSATPVPTPEPTLEPAATPEPTVALEPTVEPAPTAAPTPTPTDKPRRTPPPLPTDTPAPTADVTPSP
jgi:anti-sigma factor RsiW